MKRWEVKQYRSISFSNKISLVFIFILALFQWTEMFLIVLVYDNCKLHTIDCSNSMIQRDEFLPWFALTLTLTWDRSSHRHPCKHIHVVREQSKQTLAWDLIMAVFTWLERIWRDRPTAPHWYADQHYSITLSQCTPLFYYTAAVFKYTYTPITVLQESRQTWPAH